MPKSPIRRRNPFTPPPERINVARIGNPRWLIPLMVACFVLGLLWIVVFYVTQREYPVREIGNWNMAVGFGLIIFGFLLSTRWK